MKMDGQREIIVIVPEGMNVTTRHSTDTDGFDPLWILVPVTILLFILMNVMMYFCGPPFSAPRH